MYENFTVGRPTTHYSLEKKQFVDIIPPSKVIDENVQHYYVRPEIVHFSRPPAFNPLYT